MSAANPFIICEANESMAQPSTAKDSSEPVSSLEFTKPRPHQQEAESHEMVPDVPPNGSDEGASERATEQPSPTQSIGDQGVPDSPREAQGQPPLPAHSSMDEEAAQHHEPELLRLRVRVWNKKTHRVTYEWISVNTLI